MALQFREIDPSSNSLKKGCNLLINYVSIFILSLYFSLFNIEWDPSFINERLPLDKIKVEKISKPF